MNSASLSLRGSLPRLALGVHLPAWLAFAAAFAFCAHYYFDLKQGLFDDTYIYLAIARNALDHGTWQYYPGIVEREALLASSPARILLLTAAAAASKLLGHGGRTLFDANLTLLLSGLVTWAVFAPFWRGKMVAYAWIGAIMSVLAVAMDTVFEFEGGLLLLWMATLVMLAMEPEKNQRAIAWLLPVAPLIRPDLTLPVLVLIAVHLGMEQGRLVALAKAMRVPVAVLAGTWILVCALLDVWPVPVTYWGKAALPFMFEDSSMLSKLLERLGGTLLLDFHLPRAGFAAVGGALVLATLAALGLGQPRIHWRAIVAMTLVYALMFARMPSNFMWYYQNVVSLAVGLALGRAFAPTAWTPQRVVAAAGSALLLACFLAGRVPNDGPWQWRLTSQSRAQGYLALSLASTGHGTFELPEVGEFILRNPEIGMLSYYSTQPIFQWDSAGLAQPLDHPKVKRSPMRHFYPKALRRTAATDAQQIVDRIGKPLPVLAAWSMDNRDYAAARKACRWVIPHRALCINQEQMLVPSSRTEP
jgi:hypothetical protein